MCGIIGLFAFSAGSTAKENRVRRESMLYLFTEILERTRTRGPDATGVSALFSDGDCIIQKGNVKSPEFISNFGGGDDEYDGFINTCRQDGSDLQILMGHCRKSSVGNTWDNENNHPIKAGEIVGVHNGTLKNHEVVFEKLGCDRDGEVDSEAIMRLMQHLTNDCSDPFTLDTLWETYRRLEGAFTTISFNANNPYQAALIRKERPMEIAIIKPLKLLVVVSERVFLEETLFDYNKQAMLYGKDFNIIEDDDVEYLTLPLDNVAVVDLTREVTKETKIIDLLDKIDAFKSDKIWRVPGAKYNAGTNWQQTKNINKIAAAKAAADALEAKNKATAEELKNSTTYPKNSGSTSTKAEDKFPGKVFCKDLNAYVDPNIADTLSRSGPLLIENPGGKIIPIEKKLKEVLVKVPELDIKVLGTVLEIKEESDTKGTNTSVIELDPATDPEILKAAKMEVNALTRFESTIELTKILEASSPETVRSLEPHALANRVKAVVYEQAFIDGAIFFSKLYQKGAAQKAVRVAKHVVEVFGKVIEELSGKRTSHYKEELMSHIANIDTSELTKANIKQVFSKGNIMKNQALATLEEVAKD